MLRVQVPRELEQGFEAEGADRVLVLHKGKLLAQGTPAELVAASGCATLAEAFLKMTRSGQAVEPA